MLRAGTPPTEQPGRHAAHGILSAKPPRVIAHAYAEPLTQDDKGLMRWLQGCHRRPLQVSERDCLMRGAPCTQGVLPGFQHAVEETPGGLCATCGYACRPPANACMPRQLGGAVARHMHVADPARGRPSHLKLISEVAVRHRAAATGCRRGRGEQALLIRGIASVG